MNAPTNPREGAGMNGDGKPYCRDCGADVDDGGWSLQENGCGRSHPDDCDTCGHPCCDQSC